VKRAAESVAAIAALASQISDRTLVQFIADRDKAALKLLYSRHGARVYRFVARLTGSKSAAKEIVNEVFLEVWRDARQFKGKSPVATWLLGIAHFKALSQCRRRSEVPRDRCAQHLIADASDGPAALNEKRRNEKRRRRDILEKCMTTLTPIHLEVVNLVSHQGKKRSRRCLKSPGCLSLPSRRACTMPAATWPSCSPQRASVARGRRSSVCNTEKKVSQPPDQNQC
jgi:RNA polymerase sigma-70 factor (ECF subfamily)